MSLELKNRMAVQITAVPNEFIDTYMSAANGEYVKVFLYLLRHEEEEITISAVADALNHTDADVRRALAYWEDAGLLETGTKDGADRASGETAAASSPAELPEAESTPGKPEIPDPGDSYARMERLSEDDEFAALLYAVQQYLGKTFTQIECEKFAYYYDGLHMSADLLEYLAEYCAGGGHTSIRYIEKVALNWYQSGIRTREEARDYTMRYSRDISSVMKAFGITNRNPGTAEQEFMRKWFREYGFDSALVTEACNRTIRATGSASFPYADKILTGWKESGVRTRRDVEEFDQKRKLSRAQNSPKEREPARKTASANRFRNFEERSYDYEDYIWEDVRNRKKRGGVGDGTQ